MVCSMIDSRQPTFRATSTRPSSRRALTAALELAQEAVRLDSTNDDPIGAIRAYSRSVALLSEVMERVMHEEDDTGRGRHLGRARSMAAREEEVRRLKSIHDTYADRMIILSDIYNIDPYHLPTGDLAIPSPEFPTAEFYQSNLPRHNGAMPLRVDEPTGDPVFTSSTDSTISPGSADYDSLPPSFETTNSTHVLSDSSNPHNLSINFRHSTISSRASILPPLLPPPSGPLPGRPRNTSLAAFPLQPFLPNIAPPLVPPIPSFNSSAGNTDVVDIRSALMMPSMKPKGSSSAHQMTNSDNKLEALHEEGPDNDTSTRAQTLPALQQASSGEETPISTSSKAIDPSPPLPSKDTYISSNLLASVSTSCIASNAPSPPLSPATPRGGQSPRTASADHASSMVVSRSRGASAPTPWTDFQQQQPPIINATPSAGTISQRRTKTSTGTTSSQPTSRPSTPAQSSPTSPTYNHQVTPIVRLSGSLVPPLPSGTLTNRHRSSSQPPRPGSSPVNILISDMNARPLLSQALNVNTQLPRKPSFPSRLSSIQAPASPAQALIQSTALQASGYSSNIPSSPLPLPPPTDSVLKPYHLMALLRTTMTSKSGGYITRRLHVPNEVWSQGGVKLSNLPEKVKVVEVLSSALEEIQLASLDFASNNNILLAPKCSADDAERWLNKLDDWNSVCDSIVTTFGRKLGVNEGFVVKKSSGVPFWKVVRSMTNGKSLDSPAAYVTGLVKLFQLAQILGEHTRALLLTQVPPLYTSVPTELCRALELRLRRSSEFLASVVLTFVVKDLSLLLDKFVKRGEKWLADRSEA